MATVYMVTIRVVRDDGDAHPGEWDWRTLIDSAYPVQVVSAAEVLPLPAGE